MVVEIEDDAPLSPGIATMPAAVTTIINSAKADGRKPRFVVRIMPTPCLPVNRCATGAVIHASDIGYRRYLNAECL
jgi:hypothetical protein